MEKVELVIVGAGPAGLGAAIESAKYGVKVIVFDENNLPGGQLFKQIHKFFGSRAHMAGVRGFKIGEALLAEAKELNIPVFLNSPVIGINKEKVLAYIYQDKVHYIQADKVLFATGAMENVIQFPGWTLPGIMGAGAVQTMINIERVLPGKRILMVGTGNVGLIVSYQLIQAGAEVVAIVEAKEQIGGYGVHAAKIRRAGVPFYLKSTVLEAKGEESVEEATIVEIDRNFNPVKGTEKIFNIDLVCLAVGLSPLIELLNLLKCKMTYIPELGGWVPLHNEYMETSCKGIYIAGDVAGIEEASSALDKGRIAGISIARSLGHISQDKAIEEYMKVQRRLDELRSGPFGEARVNGSKRIFSLMEKECHE